MYRIGNRAALRPFVALPAVLLAAGWCATAGAQTARSGGSPNSQLLQQMQQLASERTTLQAENDKLKHELADVKKDRDALKAGQQAQDRRAKDAMAALDHRNAQFDATNQELEQYKAKMQELVAKFRETIQKLRDVEAEDATAKQALAGRERDLSTCVAHNAALYSLNQEVLTRLEKQGVWSRMWQSEPFTRIKRVQLENLVDDYHARAQDERLPASPTPPSAPPTQPSAAVPDSQDPGVPPH